MNDELPNVIIYVDGSYLPNHERGGAGIVLIYKTARREIKEAIEGKCNARRAELYAAVRGLLELKRPCRVTLNSDSQYVISGARGSGFRVADDLDLWLQLDKAAKMHEIEWRLVKGHSGIEMNELADTLAKRAAHNHRGNRR